MAVVRVGRSKPCLTSHFFTLSGRGIFGSGLMPAELHGLGRVSAVPGQLEIVKGPRVWDGWRIKTVFHSKEIASGGVTTCKNIPACLGTLGLYIYIFVCYMGWIWQKEVMALVLEGCMGWIKTEITMLFPLYPMCHGHILGSPRFCSWYHQLKIWFQVKLKEIQNEIESEQWHDVKDTGLLATCFSPTLSSPAIVFSSDPSPWGSPHNRPLIPGPLLAPERLNGPTHYCAMWANARSVSCQHFYI